MISMGYTEQLQNIVEKYREAGQTWPASAKAIAVWAIREQLWFDRPSTVINRCAEDLARAMREDYITDPQGRRVRSKHVALVEQNGQQIPLWDDIRTAPREHMAISFQQRRQGIVADCFHLKQEVDSYNENTQPARPIQMPLDFTFDVMEMEITRAPNAFLPPSVQSPAVAQASV